MKMVRRATRTKIKETTIFCDDREKNGWDADYLGPGFKVVRRRLETGDYTIKGMEDIVCIEKKSGWGEIAVNVGTKRLLENFRAELQRMGEYPIRFLVIHDDPSHMYHTKTYAQHIGPNTLLQWFLRIQLEYGVPILCVGNKRIAKNTVRLLFRKILEFNTQGRLYYHSESQNELYQ